MEEGKMKGFVSFFARSGRPSERATGAKPPLAFTRTTPGALSCTVGVASPETRPLLKAWQKPPKRKRPWDRASSLSAAVMTWPTHPNK